MDEANPADLSDAQLESLVLNEQAKPAERGAARAELTRRQRRHELERDQKKREHDVALFNAQSDLARLNHEFQERLARDAQAHAEALAQEQASPVRNAAHASIWAGAAAALAAVAAIISAGVALRTYTARPRETVAAQSPPTPLPQRESGADARSAETAPLAFFYTESDPSASVVGIQIQNQGIGPVFVSRVEYFVDGHPMRGADDATSRGHFLGPDRIQTLDFGPGDQLAMGEKDWLYFRSTKNKIELQKFLDFISNHVAIGMTLCTDAGRCASRCSEAGRCGPGYSG